MQLTSAQQNSDKLSIFVSITCALHCLLMPAFLITTSSFIALQIDNEFLHGVMLLIIFPISIFALLTGLFNHDGKISFLSGCIGLIILLYAYFAGEEILGEWGEIIMTLIGSAILVFAHWQNFKLCRDQACDDCHD